MRPTKTSVDEFLQSVSERRQQEAQALIIIMQAISGEPPVMWGPSIIGFGQLHYKYETGRKGDMPQLAFSPRKGALTIYFNEGFDRYAAQLANLGKYKHSISCLYINKLEDIHMETLRQMIEESYNVTTGAPHKIATVEEYVKNVPPAARPKFDELRKVVKQVLPKANEVYSYGIVGYKIDDKRARVFISGWKDHVAMYPIPKNETLRAELMPYIKGKGTLWFPLNAPLPTLLLRKTIQELSA